MCSKYWHVDGNTYLYIFFSFPWLLDSACVDWRMYSELKHNWAKNWICFFLSFFFEVAHSAQKGDCVIYQLTSIKHSKLLWTPHQPSNPVNVFTGGSVTGGTGQWGVYIWPGVPARGTENCAAINHSEGALINTLIIALLLFSPSIVKPW